MKASEIYEAVYDSARQEYLPPPNHIAKNAKEVEDYAFGALNIVLSDSVCLKIAKIRALYFDLAEENGEWECAYHRIMDKLDFEV